LEVDLYAKCKEPLVELYDQITPVTMFKYFLFLVFLLKGSSSFCQENETIITAYYTHLEVNMNEPFVIKTFGCSGCPHYWYLDPIDTTKIKMLRDSIETRDIAESRVGGNKYDRWKFVIKEKGKYVLNFYHKEIGYNGTEKPWVVELRAK
jgi:hypothetical protein